MARITGAHFTIESSRFVAIGNAALPYDAGAALDHLVNTAWPYAEAHQLWIDTAPVAEVASWLTGGLADWSLDNLYRNAR